MQRSFVVRLTTYYSSMNSKSKSTYIYIHFSMNSSNRLTRNKRLLALTFYWMDAAPVVSVESMQKTCMWDVTEMDTSHA